MAERPNLHHFCEFTRTSSKIKFEVNNEYCPQLQLLFFIKQNPTINYLILLLCH